MGGMGGMDF